MSIKRNARTLAGLISAVALAMTLSGAVLADAEGGDGPASIGSGTTGGALPAQAAAPASPTATSFSGAALDVETERGQG